MSIIDQIYDIPDFPPELEPVTPIHLYLEMGNSSTPCMQNVLMVSVLISYVLYLLFVFMLPRFLQIQSCDCDRLKLLYQLILQTFLQLELLRVQ